MHRWCSSPGGRDRLDEVAGGIVAQGGQAIAIEADITRRNEAEGAVARTVRELGALDILVNNAGVMLLGPVADAPVEEWDRMLAVNVQGLLYCAHAALPHLIRSGSSGVRGVSDIVNVSSTAGRVARSGTAVYNLTKFGVGAFSEALRQEVTRRHVRVSLIEPGAVKTELVDHLRPGVREQTVERLSSFERLEPEDIADAISLYSHAPPARGRERGPHSPHGAGVLARPRPLHCRSVRLQGETPITFVLGDTNRGTDILAVHDGLPAGPGSSITSLASGCRSTSPQRSSSRTSTPQSRLSSRRREFVDLARCCSYSTYMLRTLARTGLCDPRHRPNSSRCLTCHLLQDEPLLTSTGGTPCTTILHVPSR